MKFNKYKYLDESEYGYVEKLKNKKKANKNKRVNKLRKKWKQIRKEKRGWV